jgi:hypothetical protein
MDFTPRQLRQLTSDATHYGMTGYQLIMSGQELQELVESLCKGASRWLRAGWCSFNGRRRRFRRPSQHPGSKLAAWLEANVPESLSVMALPMRHRKRMRTTNQLERLNRELKRRTRVATLFQNEAALLRLVTGVLMEISEEWEIGKRYLTFENQETK